MADEAKRRRRAAPEYCICYYWLVCSCGNQPPYHCELCCLPLDPDQIFVAQYRGDLPPEHVVCEENSLTLDEARESIVSGIDYAAYKETDSSLHDSDKNRLFGSERYNSGRTVASPSPWAEGDFEEKMAMLLRWANTLNRSVPGFGEAQKLLQDEDSVIGRVIRRAMSQKR